MVSGFNWIYGMRNMAVLINKLNKRYEAQKQPVEPIIQSVHILMTGCLIEGVYDTFELATRVKKGYDGLEGVTYNILSCPVRKQ